MNKTTREMLNEHMQSITNTLTYAFEALDNGEEYEDMDAHDFLMEYPLEVIDERGRNWAVVLTVGGPHIEIEAEGHYPPRLVGYWGGERVQMADTSRGVYERMMDLLIDRD